MLHVVIYTRVTTPQFGSRLYVSPVLSLELAGLEATLVLQYQLDIQPEALPVLVVFQSEDSSSYSLSS
jgi:hypothetical protein